MITSNPFMITIVTLIYGIIATSTFLIVLLSEDKITKGTVGVAVFWGVLWPIFYTAAVILRLFMFVK